MSDEAAFAAAVAADPAADLPRLVFADWLDDHDQPDRAEFVRAQVRAAATPAWEPFAVYCRHRRPEWTTGDPWRSTLPPVDGWAVEWHPDRAFSRGFGYSLIVRDLNVFLADAPRLFDAAPVGELHLPTGTLDQWRAVGRAAWLPRVKSVHFYGTTTPIEPVRVLCESPLATGIEAIVFEVCSRPGMPVLLDGLFASALGRRLKSLELRSGPEDPDALVEPFAALRTELSLDRFALSRVRMTDIRVAIDLFYRTMGGFRVLDLDRCSGGFYGGPPWSFLRTVAALAVRGSDITLTRSEARQSLLRAVPVWLPPAARAVAFPRALLTDTSVSRLTDSPNWPSLTELDLRDNQITDRGAEHLLAHEPPADLTALLLGGNPISDDVRSKLRRHFGPAVIFDD